MQSERSCRVKFCRFNAMKLRQHNNKNHFGQASILIVSEYCQKMKSKRDLTLSTNNDNTGRMQASEQSVCGRIFLCPTVRNAVWLHAWPLPATVCVCPNPAVLCPVVTHQTTSMFSYTMLGNLN